MERKGPTDFEKLINQKIRERNSLLIFDTEKKLLGKVEVITRYGGLLLMLLIGLSVSGQLERFKKNEISIFEFVGYCLLPFAVLLMHQLIYYKLNSKPSIDKDKDEWLYSEGRKYIIYLLLVRTFGLFCISLYTNFRIAVISSLAFLVHDLILLKVLNNPKLILSNLLRGIGTSCFTFGFSAFTVEILAFSLDPKINTITFNTILNAILFTVLSSTVISRRIKDGDTEIDIIQKQFLKYIEPKRVYEVFKSEYQIAVDKLKAQKIILKLKEKESFGIELALFEILLKEHSNKTKIKYLTGTLIGFLVFIAASIGEGFFQDLIYEPYIKPFLCPFIKNLC